MRSSELHLLILFLVSASAHSPHPLPPPSPNSSLSGSNQTLPPAPLGSSRTLRSALSGKNGSGAHNRVDSRKFFSYVPSNNDRSFTNQTLLAEEFIHTHNWVRRQYKLPPLSWEEKLASYARGYLMQRYGDCKLIHSSPNNYGENLFWGKRLHWTPSDATYHWYQEKNWYDLNALTCAPPPKECGHFTQMVWRDTQRIGCALQHCQNRSAGMLIACEYDPAGNYQNENPLQHHA